MPLFELTKLSKIYTDGEVRTEALSNVDLAIEQGDFLAVTGASGSGKTTLIHLLSTVDRNFGGQIEFSGESMTAWSERRAEEYRVKDIGLVFQRFFLLKELTVVENVALPYWLLHNTPLKAREEALELIARFGLERFANRAIVKLSSGELQRVAIARAMINRPSVILADEPTAHLDAQNAEQVARLLGEINNMGTTVVVTTHDPVLAKHASRSANLSYGALESEGGAK